MLNRRIAVYIPSTVKGNVQAPSELTAKLVRQAKIKFSTMFGGFTATPGIGGWVSAEHGLIEENVMIVASFTDDEGIARHADEVRTFALTIALAMEQESVSVQIDNGLEFVTAAPAVEVKAI